MVCNAFCALHGTQCFRYRCPLDCTTRLPYAYYLVMIRIYTYCFANKQTCGGPVYLYVGSFYEELFLLLVHFLLPFHKSGAYLPALSLPNVPYSSNGDGSSNVWGNFDLLP
ncbi:hypothetical protein TNCV_3874121 [Trichonephila clavipes]|nr:hypothetical protein TNCV_3874121 [Trichonephila clavipes]